jgi:hypothetical protein
MMGIVIKRVNLILRERTKENKENVQMFPADCLTACWFRVQPSPVPKVYENLSQVTLSFIKQKKTHLLPEFLISC